MAALPQRSMLDVAGYVAALSYGDEAWRVCYTCRLGYHGDGSESAQLLLRALATRTRTDVDEYFEPAAPTECGH
jgi:hypothetical protein